MSAAFKSPTGSWMKFPERFDVLDVIRYPRAKCDLSGEWYHRYQILEYIGRGAYGYVYKIKDLDTGEIRQQGFGSQSAWRVERTEGK